MGHSQIGTTERYLHARPATELADRFNTALGGVSAERDHAGPLRDVGTPAAVVGPLIDDDVFAQRRCSSPLALRMLPRVPTGAVALPLPGMHDVEGAYADRPSYL